MAHSSTGATASGSGRHSADIGCAAKSARSRRDTAAFADSALQCAHSCEKCGLGQSLYTFWVDRRSIPLDDMSPATSKHVRALPLLAQAPPYGEPDLAAQAGGIRRPPWPVEAEPGRSRQLKGTHQIARQQSRQPAPKVSGTQRINHITLAVTATAIATPSVSMAPRWNHCRASPNLKPDGMR